VADRPVILAAMSFIRALQRGATLYIEMALFTRILYRSPRSWGLTEMALVRCPS